MLVQARTNRNVFQWQPLHRPAALAARPFRCVATTSYTARLKRVQATARESHSTITVKVPNPEGPAFSASLQVPDGADVYQVSLKKPLGFTLTETGGAIVVDDVVPNSHAAQAGIKAGDLLLATTARAQAGASSAVTQVVLLCTAGQSFKTVAAALRSNTCSQCNINLVLQRRLS